MSGFSCWLPGSARAYDDYLQTIQVDDLFFSFLDFAASEATLL